MSKDDVRVFQIEGSGSQHSIAVLAEAAGLMVQPGGTGVQTMEDNEGYPIVLEHYEGRWRLLVWDDINDEEPSHIIELDGALEARRSGVDPSLVRRVSALLRGWGAKPTSETGYQYLVKDTHWGDLYVRIHPEEPRVLCRLTKPIPDSRSVLRLGSDGCFDLGPNRQAGMTLVDVMVKAIGPLIKDTKPEPTPIDAAEQEERGSSPRLLYIRNAESLSLTPSITRIRERAPHLKPGQTIFVMPGEGASPGWYIVNEPDIEQWRMAPKDGMWWRCTRRCDGLKQSVAELDPCVITDMEGAPGPAAPTAPRARRST